MKRVILTSIEHEPEPGRVRMRVKIGDEPEKVFLGDYDGSDEKYKHSSVEEELFMQLSDLAMKRYCNCAIYQMELMGIMRAFIEGSHMPPMPIELGTTDFGMKRPTAAKVAVSRMCRPFLYALYWWKFRHIRRENIEKYGTAKQDKPNKAG